MNITFEDIKKYAADDRLIPFDGHIVKGALVRSQDSELLELARKAVAVFGPETTQFLVRNPALLRAVANGDIQVSKQRHSNRDEASGKFIPAGHVRYGGWLWRDAPSGKAHPALRGGS